MPENIKKSIKGVKAQNFNAVLMIAGCLLTLFVFYTSLTIKKKYDDIVVSMNDYSECNKAIYELRDASDFLTDQVRLFSLHHDTVYLQNYFFEINELKRREMAIDIIEMTHQGDTPDINAKSALFESEMLEKTEIYAMKLICDAIHMQDEEIPEVIKKTNLWEADKYLIDEAKLAKAHDLLFGDDYFNSKDRITFYTSCAITSLIHSSVKEQRINDKAIKSIFFSREFLFAFYLLFVLLCTYSF